ncbi:hypothetical protein HCH_05506 [Hahella chejuensis KCTC 2396]|uniref:Lipoprotein n=1 Tax=Hahella chejuensis (strain KCTC 2396) TaxID=349521 RepID=Q2SB06_HAHCH|nr:hypothetical protein [Hahella chejuensis]ABC32168.1 hypothetical protein HCH_05506 [Hahella chejuensis KCTC 2396]
MKIALIFLAFLTLASCSTPPDLDAIQTRFETDTTPYEKLTAMVTEDFQGEYCFSVGVNIIGDFREYSDGWSHTKDYESKLSLSQVLKDVSISENRYKSYLALFKTTQSERITFCPPSKYYIMAHRSGLGISGCLLDIVKGVTPPAAYGKRNNGEDFMEVRVLNNEWWMEYKCT